MLELEMAVAGGSVLVVMMVGLGEGNVGKATKIGVSEGVREGRSEGRSTEGVLGTSVGGGGVEQALRMRSKRMAEQMKERPQVDTIIEVSSFCPFVL